MKNERISLKVVGLVSFMWWLQGKLCCMLFCCEKVNLISGKPYSCRHLITSY